MTSRAKSSEHIWHSNKITHESTHEWESHLCCLDNRLRKRRKRPKGRRLTHEEAAAVSWKRRMERLSPSCILHALRLLHSADVHLISILRWSIGKWKRWSYQKQPSGRIKKSVNEIRPLILSLKDKTKWKTGSFAESISSHTCQWNELSSLE